MDMSVTEILKELPKLSPTDRAAVWKKLGEITEADVPATFRQGMRDIGEAFQQALLDFKKNHEKYK
jgi:hypothetical protein